MAPAAVPSQNSHSFRKKQFKHLVQMSSRFPSICSRVLPLTNCSILPTSPLSFLKLNYPLASSCAAVLDSIVVFFLKGEKAPLRLLITLSHTSHQLRITAVYKPIFFPHSTAGFLTYFPVWAPRSSWILTWDHPIMLIWSLPFAFQRSFYGFSSQEIQFL